MFPLRSFPTPPHKHLTTNVPSLNHPREKKIKGKERAEEKKVEEEEEEAVV